MYRSFKEIEDEILSRKDKKVLALAGAHDSDVLSAVVNAKRKGIIDAILIGHVGEIKRLLKEMDESEGDYTFIEKDDENSCARCACQLVKEEKAHIPMKGLMQTSTFMHAILDRESYGFVPEKGILSQCTIMEHEGRFLFITDCAVNISPDYQAKLKILKNAVVLANKMGIEVPKAAVLAPVEVINPNMPSTIDAAMLSKASERGQLGNCIVDGPFGMDNALSSEAAMHKGIKSQVAGHPDILLVPDLCTGNILTKGLVFLAKGIKSAGLLRGTTTPVVMTSRTDTPENKYFAILVEAM